MSKEALKNNERKDVSKEKEEKGKKPGKMLDAIKKIGAKPLASSVMTVATSALLMTGCVASDKPEQDAQAEEDADDDSMHLLPPPVVTEVPPRIPRDAETEGDAVGDVAEDTVEEVDVVEDITDEEVVEVSCNARNSTRTEVIYIGGSATVGNIDVRYDGPTTSGEGEYSILCDGTVVRSGITVAAGSTETVDVTEQSFSVELTPSSVNPFNTMVSISVDAY